MSDLEQLIEENAILRKELAEKEKQLSYLASNACSLMRFVDPPDITKGEDDMLSFMLSIEALNFFPQYYIKHNANLLKQIHQASVRVLDFPDRDLQRAMAEFEKIRRPYGENSK